MKWILGNVFSVFSILGMVFFTLLLAAMILSCGIDLWEAVKDDRWGRALWEIIGVVVFIYWSTVWITKGVDWWIAMDHKVQGRLFGKIY